ncbi:hypothetical protein OHB26_09490 [Nocardia sp. NBC_01503]|uniref:hypothetical protein n=1 Tax=Nocardia sp. NBC_01503 TaxID=2975997 RepID=UPI002E7B39BB|nr:hypothetical protein [Nocardia sp. NBC_01503]WTL34408.1 hypothetical protein OHB26_09490 [Nocardia sp. NBC_01503]
MTRNQQILRIGQLYRDAMPGRSDLRTLRVDEIRTPTVDYKGRTLRAVTCTVIRKVSDDGAVTTPMRVLGIDAVRLTSDFFELVEEQR